MNRTISKNVCVSVCLDLNDILELVEGREVKVEIFKSELIKEGILDDLENEKFTGLQIRNSLNWESVKKLEFIKTYLNQKLKNEAESS